jgi:hypothetical protein
MQFSVIQVAKLTGHSYRVLYLAMSPDGKFIYILTNFTFYADPDLNPAI